MTSISHSLNNYREDDNLANGLILIFNVKFHRDTKKTDAIFWKSVKSDGKMVGRDISLPDRTGFIGVVKLNQKGTHFQKIATGSLKLIELSGLNVIPGACTDQTLITIGTKYNIIQGIVDLRKLSFDLNRSITDPFFKSIHCIDRLGDSLLVTSTGFDTLIEINNKNFARSWIWHAWENGYSQSPSGWHITSSEDLHNKLSAYGKKVIFVDKLNPKSAKNALPTPRQTTHINSAVYSQYGTILTTLFHQGCLLEIDPKTGNSRVILSGMKNPHHVTRLNIYGKNYTAVTDTARGILNILDEKLRLETSVDFKKQIGRYTNGFHWLQSVCAVDENIVVGVDGVLHNLIVVDLLNGVFRKIKYDDFWYIHTVFPA
jgi:hypothetical protein